MERYAGLQAVLCAVRYVFFHVEFAGTYRRFAGAAHRRFVQGGMGNQM